MPDRSEKYERVYYDVFALYSVLKAAQETQGLPLRRAAIRSNGEVAAEAIDFLCDVELKARRVLNQTEFEVLFPMDMLGIERRVALGKTFYEHRLGIGGDYKSLYFHIKQVTDGGTMEGIQYGRETDTTPTLNEYERKEQ